MKGGPGGFGGGMNMEDILVSLEISLEGDLEDLEEVEEVEEEL